MADTGDQRAVSRVRRSELAAFLKSRRARITPQDVGLPPGPRRRTPGLRREEVAQLAGVGVTWYTWLEQGRPINVSVQVLEAISRTLALDAAERAHLYRLADVPTVPPLYGEEVVPEEYQIILDHLTPLPAALLSARYDVLANNEAYAALCPDFIAGEHNVIRAAFLTPGCCNPYAMEEQHLARMVGYLRAAYGRNLGDPAWTEFVEKLSAESPKFARLWARNDVANPLHRTKTIRNVITGDMQMYMTNMSVPSLAGAWVSVLTPIDEDCWTVLRNLLAMPASERDARRHDHAATHDRRPPLIPYPADH